MSLLDHIVKEANKNPRGAEESWLALMNTYFRGEKPYEQVRNWALKNGLEVTFIGEGNFKIARVAF